MAELKLDIDTECEQIDVETDAAPSSDYVHLASLDIGSEYTVVTEPKEDVNRQAIVILEEDEHIGQAEYDIEIGVNSLNLDKSFHPQPGDEGADGFQYLIRHYADEIEIRKCLDEIAILFQQDGDGDTLLHTAIILLNSELALALIEYAACMPGILDTQNNIGQTPLHLAVLTEQQNVVRQLLLTAGASYLYRDQFLRTPMHIACENNDFVMLAILLAKDWFTGGQHSLFGRLRTTYSDMVSAHLRNVFGDCFRTELGVVTTSRLLDPATHPLNLPNADGERCLHLAVRHKNIEIARTLIENGADVNLPDRRSGRTPLHVAADLGHEDMARFLTSVENIDINQKTYNEETALEIAHMRGRENIVALLKPLCYSMMKRKTKSDQSA